MPAKKEFEKSDHFLAVYMQQGQHGWCTFGREVWEQLVVEIDNKGLEILSAKRAANDFDYYLPMAHKMGFKNGHGFIIPEGRQAQIYFQELIDKICIQLKNIPGWSKFKAYTPADLDDQKGITNIELRSGYGEGWRYEGKLHLCEYYGVKAGPIRELFEKGHVVITKSCISDGPSKSAGIFLKVDKLGLKTCQVLGAIQVLHSAWEFWCAGTRLNPATGGGSTVVRNPVTPPETPSPPQAQGQQQRPPAQPIDPSEQTAAPPEVPLPDEPLDMDDADEDEESSEEMTVDAEEEKHLLADSP